MTDDNVDLVDVPDVEVELLGQKSADCRICSSDVSFGSHHDWHGEVLVCDAEGQTAEVEGAGARVLQGERS